MGLLNFFGQPTVPPLLRLPSGSFTMDRSGRLVISTLPSSLDAALLDEIGHQVIHAFKAARAAHLPLSELNIQYRSLKITARDLAGGAFVFFTPITPISTNPLN